MAESVTTNFARGFEPNVRSMTIATFTMLLLYLFFLLLKYLVNLFTSRGGYPGGKTMSGYDSFRKSRKTGATAGGLSPMPPVPPPAAPGQEAGLGISQGATGGMSPTGGMGAGGGMYGGYGEDQTQGIESEKGHPNDSPYSQSLSRAADVSRLGYLVLLGGTVINALSFDANASGNVLCWILFALFVLWALLALFSRSRVIPFVLSLFVLGVTIAFYAVSYSF